MSKDPSEKLGIYIHIPYCLKKCSYCAFNSYPGGSVPGEYISSLTSEIGWIRELLRLEGRVVDTIYFGGGTPSLMESAQIEEIINSISGQFCIEGDAEITLELNPATADRAKLEGIKKGGINRLSIGVQSFNEKNLNFLGRLHSGSEAADAFIAARETGFDNISMDLIFALPGQTEDELGDDLAETVRLNPEHISLYSLTLEEGTPLLHKAERGDFKACSDSIQHELFQFASDYLEGHDFTRYETSNYARRGLESRHNLKYWSGQDYIGIGAGAHSFLRDAGWGMRWWNVAYPECYLEAIRSGVLPVDELELLNRTEALTEAIFTRLRTREGLSDEYLMERFGLGLHEALSENGLNAIPGEMIDIGNDRISLTQKGALMADEIAARIIK